MSGEDDVPPARQCTFLSCANEATDPNDPRGLCSEHLEDLEFDTVDTGTEAENSGGGTPETNTQDGDSWDNADFQTPASDTYPPELIERKQWMARKGKLPFAPYADRNHPEAGPEDDARWKWGIQDNYTTAEKVALAEQDPRVDGRVFIQLEDDPFAFVDGDDVRCPETGDVHPRFIELLEEIGLTYADVSTSGAGVHAYYKGELPIKGKGQATFEIDDEPWGENDSPPAVEIYANKHVNVAAGEHIPGTPLNVSEWDADALRETLKQNGYEDKKSVLRDTDRDRPDLENYDPKAVDSDESTTEIKAILHAVDRLRPFDLPLRSQHTGEDSTGWETWDPSYRVSESGKRVHRPPGEAVFHDHKEGESFGILGLFAAEQENQQLRKENKQLRAWPFTSRLARLDSPHSS